MERCKICDRLTLDLDGKDSVHYFFYHMTQDEFDEKIKGKRLNEDFKFNTIQPERSKREDVFVYRPDTYQGPIAINATPSKECKEYHKNSCIQINVNDENILKRCGALNSNES